MATRLEDKCERDEKKAIYRAPVNNASHIGNAGLLAAVKKLTRLWLAVYTYLAPLYFIIYFPSHTECVS